MKNILILISLSVFCLQLNAKAFAFNHAQECVRWVIGNPVVAQMDKIKDSKAKKVILDKYIEGASVESLKKIDACKTLFTNGEVTNVKGNPFIKSVCCNCSGGCAALWILLSYCETCLAVSGGGSCCSECKMPASPGGSCQ